MPRRTAKLTDTEEYIDYVFGLEYSTVMDYLPHSIEDDHSFIQWMFPTTTRSLYNSSAPLLDICELRCHKSFEKVKEGMLEKSVPKMKAHWGIKGRKVENVDKLQLLNGHNGLRFSRVLQSMVYHDLADEAERLLNLVLSFDSRLSPAMKGSVSIWECRFLEAKEEVKALGL